jgi:methionyl-tRNA synthetase
VAKAAKKTVKKRKTKKAKAGNKAPRAGAKRAAAKKAKKQPKKTAKKAVKKTVKKAAKKAAKKTVKETTKKTPKRAAKKTQAEKVTVTPKKAETTAAKPVAPKVPKASSAPAPKATTASAKNSFYITTAIAYPNGVPHIGHAYEAIATDALARFQRLDGKDVFFLTGTDEHGLKMIQTAEAEGLKPMEVATRNAQRFKEMDQRLNISFDRFIRTTEEQHHRSSQEIWKRMADNGDIYLDSYAGWYSVRDEAYYAEDETTLGEDDVRRGPQGTPVEWVEEKSYFFRLSAYQDRLLALYETHPEFIGPDSRKNEVVSFVKGGLRDLSISRTTFDWGVKVPGEPEHVMYVWVDALTNYITGVGFPDEGDKDWHYWPADVHIIGKDIIRFHAVYWPAFLMSAGIPVQKRVYAHGFLFNRGEKMS